MPTDSLRMARIHPGHNGPPPSSNVIPEPVQNRVNEIDGTNSNISNDSQENLLQTKVGSTVGNINTSEDVSVNKIEIVSNCSEIERKESSTILNISNKTVPNIQNNTERSEDNLNHENIHNERKFDDSCQNSTSRSVVNYSGVPNKRAARLFDCEKFFHPSHSY